MQLTYNYVDVIVPLPLQATFTYSIPSELNGNIALGQRVVVQFGNKKFYMAIVRALHNNKPVDYETKPIVSILDNYLTINEFQFRFWDWMSEYYLCSKGEILKAALPSGLKLESETKIALTNLDSTTIQITDKEQSILDFLNTSKSHYIQDVLTVLNKKDTLNSIKSLLDKKIITVFEDIKQNFKPKLEQYISINGNVQDARFINKVSESLKGAKKQLQAFAHLMEFLNNNNLQEVERKKFLQDHDISVAILNQLILKEIVLSIEKEVSRLEHFDIEPIKEKELNTFQASALENINNEFITKDVVLLHGITSSGKTEIYIHLIKNEIAKGKQVLYLLPEIALTTQIINRLRLVFGSEIGVYHSRFNDSERVEIWNNFNQANKDYKIILGVRSSIFLPFKNLGLIIVDEEHENTYKQYDPAPRYHARDCAIILASLHKAKVLLGTATPSIETYYNAKAGKYGLVELFKRHKEIALPNIVIVDMKKAYKQKAVQHNFSSILLNKIELALQNKEQVILFQNRRGYSPYIECRDCGKIPTCKYCEVSLTFHKATNSLVCHYCGYTIKNKANCHYCSSYELKSKGFGTEKIEDDLQNFFPHARLDRMDLDTTRAKNAYSSIISDFENHKTDILIGTQMVTKGLDFENVSLVGVLSAENMLSLPDFRAYERAFHLMTQVAGRAGRSKKQGEVIIQSLNPENFIIQDVVANNYQHFYSSLLQERKEFSYPPFSRLIRITIKHKEQATLDFAALTLSQWLKNSFSDRILGPEYPPINKIQNLYIKNILIKIEKEKPLKKAKELISNYIHEIKISNQFKSLQIIINVDPY
ncbi:MAG: primosomal protein N' [Bacteroidales bacterium]|nr:primosomal protein N' [Bacteroidales bacterium]